MIFFNVRGESVGNVKNFPCLFCFVKLMLYIWYMNRLKDLIGASGLKHKYIAEQLGIDKTYLSAMLNGHRQMPEKTQVEIARICSRVSA